MNKNIATVPGFKCWGAHTGIKSMRRDLAIIYSEVPAATAAVFTQNEIQAEPVKVSKAHLKDHTARVIVCNAGNANACTGKQGYEGAMAMATTTAKELDIEPNDVVVASTGLIGEPFPTEDIVEGIKENLPKITNSSFAGSFAANAILTTDTFAKEGFTEFELDGKTISMAGIAKGSGMIHPNMATMLCFIVCDVAIDKKLLQETLEACTVDSFNMITVDGDTSTNDMAVVMANGVAGNKEIKNKKDPNYKLFREQLQKLTIHLARLIVSDGEGASKFVEYQLLGAKTKDQARKVIREVSDSTLVKAAMFGRDPNWGRIICAAGNAGAGFDYKKVDLYIGSSEKQYQVLSQGSPVDFDRNILKKELRHSNLQIRLELNQGKEKATAWGSDLSTDYVMFNSVYTT